MKIHVPPHIQSLVPYKPGKPISDLVSEYGLEQVDKLASNENPLGASPVAIAAAIESMKEAAYYPNGGKSIREALATRYGLTIDEIIAGSGSEGVMNTVMRTFLVEGDEVLTSEGTFGGFYVLAHAMGLKLMLAPMKDYGYDLDAIVKLVTPQTRLIYLANPNNPTGSYFNKQALVEFLTAVPNDVLVMYDEAYYDFAIDDVADYPSLLTAHIPNVVTLRTFSKSHGLAGLRIGFGVSSPEIIQLMMKVRLPFEPSGPAQAAGIGALQDEKFLLQTIEVNREGKLQWKKALTELGLKFVETAANFYCVILETPREAERILHKLERAGIIVRPLTGFGMPNALRISIGTMQQNARAIAVLNRVMKSSNS